MNVKGLIVRRAFLSNVACLLIAGSLVGCQPAGPEMAPSPPPEERLLPTRTGLSAPATQTVSPLPTIKPAATPQQPVPTPSPPATPELLPTIAYPLDIPADPSWRFGAVDRMSDLNSRDVESLGAGWFLTGFGAVPATYGVDLVYLIPVQSDTDFYQTDALAQFVASRPGSIWQVGNEPDISWQSNCTPEQYAMIYDLFYRFIKKADPAALVAPGAIAQPTELRMEYLDMILEAYQERFDTLMPVDVWAIHNVVLREERDQWGIGIPPGMPDATGILVEIEDNDRLDIFQQQVVDFRAWMRDRGYRDRPLLITEFSILMPYYYGYDTERVAAFMTGAFDFFMTAVDDRTGYPVDGNRLVQRWAWYSLAAADYPTGNLTDPETGELTTLGHFFADTIGDR